MTESIKNFCQIPKPLIVAADTNVLIGLINEDDRLHDDCVELVKRADKLFFPKTALVETVTGFSRKTLEVLADAFQFVLTTGKAEYSALLGFLNKKRPRYNNFNKYIAKQFSKTWEKYGDPYFVFRELSQVVRELLDLDKIDEYLTKRLSAKLNMCKDELESKLHVYKIDWGNSRDLELYRSISEKLRDRGIVFKDDFDREIFIETAVHSAKTHGQLVFVTDDEEFCKKANRALEVLNIRGLSFCKLGEILRAIEEEKSEKIDLLRLTEEVLRRDWDSEEDEFWDDY